MRLIGLTALVMVAFAANSVLNRAAVGAGEIGALDFALVRAVAGAAVLVLLLRLRHARVPLLEPRRALGGLMLTTYLVGFSLAYLAMDAGLGALILFGGVQVTMFAGALALGERPPARRWVGAGLALAGLGWLVWPGGDVAAPLWAVAAMGAAAAGWGVYSLLGRGSADPLGDTGAAFVWATAACFLAVLVQTGGATANDATALGLALAVISGAVTSGLGYALWYAVLPRLGASVAGLVQLSVPVIAALGGAVLLAEAPGLRMLAAGALVLGGIAWGLMPQRTRGSSAS
ncbi:DMT family transporter [Roseicyclus persicicus]|uniref:DMT family transporter n=1 Tax=Roseicyclus persicicus TaxID=2650661 RepID=A0A7X6JYA8_9RHOB|nr:DMT family transporter [Roseibacterium persicicum]NKX44264.1 DMT family transporter [Roseibacterium persicicum]